MVENIGPHQTWEALRSHPGAKLVDVRTQMEWDTIGVVDMAGAGSSAAYVSWQLAPSMQVNGAFIAEMKAAGIGPEDEIYFLCRSGVRSLAAAAAAREAGFAKSYNIDGGFEGPPDATGARGHLAGWQAEGLPWRR